DADADAVAATGTCEAAEGKVGHDVGLLDERGGAGPDEGTAAPAIAAVGWASSISHPGSEGRSRRRDLGWNPRNGGVRSGLMVHGRQLQHISESARHTAEGSLIGCFQGYGDVPPRCQEDGHVDQRVAYGDRFDVKSHRWSGFVGGECERFV